MNKTGLAGNKQPVFNQFPFPFLSFVKCKNSNIKTKGQDDESMRREERSLSEDVKGDRRRVIQK